MTPTSLVSQQRISLAELLLEVGPDAPTLCEGWTARDLVAHLVIREGRPDAAIGILGGPLAPARQSGHPLPSARLTLQQTSLNLLSMPKMFVALNQTG